jgi:Fe-S-cluster containining protein
MTSSPAPSPAEIEARVREDLARATNGGALIKTLLDAGVSPRRHLPIVGRGPADGPDKYALRDLPRIDCGALLPICRGRCCTLTFTVSKQDIADGIRWDATKPYANAKREDGYCTHHESGGCTVYDRRPAVCRTYDCRNDPRIWIDFSRRIVRP